jgi:hypothetical protein
MFTRRAKTLLKSYHSGSFTIQIILKNTFDAQIDKIMVSYKELWKQRLGAFKVGIFFVES